MPAGVSRRLLLTGQTFFPHSESDFLWLLFGVVPVPGLCRPRRHAVDQAKNPSIFRMTRHAPSPRRQETMSTSEERSFKGKSSPEPGGPAISCFP